MPESNFDIYQTETGYTAVTNEVRRAILNALAKKERGLPELVKITGKAKPTLSSVHMKELLTQHLIEELPHPTDNRRKIYRLKARRIGSSSIPVDQLRSAVKAYASLSPLSSRVPLGHALESIAAAPAEASADVLRAQCARLGELTAQATNNVDARDPVTATATALEQEGLARPLRLDLEHHALDLELAPALLPDTEPARLATLLGALVQGFLRARGHTGATVDVQPQSAPRRLTLHLRGVAPTGPPL